MVRLEVCECREREEPARRDVRGPDEPGEKRGLDQEHDLRGAHEPELVHPVDEHPGVQREEQDRERAGLRDEPQSCPLTSVEKG